MNYKVFVVDDDVTTGLMVESMLNEEAVVENFTSAAACLERLSSGYPDLFLLDVEMPEMDGYELIARLDADAQLRTIPVYAVSSFEDLAERLAPHANVQGCFGKPWDEPLVLSTLAQRLGTAAAPH